MSADREVLREATAFAGELSTGLVSLERSPDDEAVSELFRAAHTLKGNCSMAGMDDAATLAHAIEDFLAAVRSGDVSPSERLMDAALVAVDEIEMILQAVGDDTTPAVDPEATSSHLRESLEQETGSETGERDIDLELPEPDSELSAEEALERASVFDDLDRLESAIDGDEAFAGLEGAGTFDAIEQSPLSEGQTPARVETSTSATPSDSTTASGEGDERDDPIIWVKDETLDTAFEWVTEETTDEPDIDAIESELDDVSFGEFDDDDDMSIQELIDIDPTDEGPQDGARSPEMARSDASQAGRSEAPRATGRRPVTAEQSPATERNKAPRTARSTPSQTAESTFDSSAPIDPADIEVASDDEILEEIETIDLKETDSSTEEDEIAFDREAGTEAFAERFGELFDVDSDSERTRSVGTIEDSGLDTARFRQEPSVDVESAETSIHSISVDRETADDLLNIVEEFTMTRLSCEDAISDASSEGRDILGSLLSIEAELRRSVLDLRLMEFTSVIDGLDRVVRDIARDQDKRISMDIEGSVKLDRSVAERISEPLVHLIRNAADHGIEPPEEREAAGKPAEGRIELRAERVRNGAIIEVADDGRGIESEEVLESALTEGLVTRSEAETMDEEDIYELLFHQGLTTSEEVTNVSGRGVGMDIVSRVCADLDGSVEVESEPGEGTTVRLRLPVTVAMADLLFLEASGERYAIPVSAIDQIGTQGSEIEITNKTFAPEPSHDQVESDEYDQYRLVRLHEAFDVSPPSTEAGSSEERSDVVWLRPEIGRIAIQCDDILGSREAIVKPYGPPLDDISGISGATVDESGDVINIIDATTLA